MRAASLYQGKIQVRDIADPTPGHGEILVRTRACGICASDIHFMDHPEGDADDDSGLSCYDHDHDIVMGHEFCAEVVDYGPGTERKWEKGTRVSSIPLLVRSDSHRIIGYAPDAPGAFGEYFCVTEALAQYIEGNLPDELVALSDAMAVGWRAQGGHPAQLNPAGHWLRCDRSLGDRGDEVSRHRPHSGGRLREVATGNCSGNGGRYCDRPRGNLAISEVERGRQCDSRRRTRHGGPDDARARVRGGHPRRAQQHRQILPSGYPYLPAGRGHLHTMTAKRKGLNMQFGGGPSIEDWNTALKEVSSGRLDVTPMTGRLVGLGEMPQAIDDACDANGPARIGFVPTK